MWGVAGADPSWHQSGRVLNKLNSIYDFVACGKYMIDEGLVHRNQLGAMGISAGCLLVGAAVNMHPELFRAAISKVLFLDVRNTLLDSNCKARDYIILIRGYLIYEFLE
ncbi:uncharacterized protein [Primulina huaijiensis]|uniref:uncharacterized protein n=1 Tax=Primulina huaijiensis TaxID=1492673 RepID=UPI003CC72E43